jgi:hypothetical protein
MEIFKEHSKDFFDGYAQVTTKGLIATQRFASDATLYRLEYDLEFCVDFNAFLKAP